jgi:hypothetical protein
MPQPSGIADGLTQGLQKCLIAGEHDELDNVAREAEPQRIQRAAVFIRS